MLNLTDRLQDLDYFVLFLKSHIKDESKFKDILSEIFTEAYEFKTGIKTLYSVSSRNFEIVEWLYRNTPEIIDTNEFTVDDCKLVLSKLTN